QPVLDLIHSPTVAFDREHHLDRLSRSRRHLVTVPEQKLVRDGGGSALVTADPWVILNESEVERWRLAGLGLRSQTRRLAADGLGMTRRGRGRRRRSAARRVASSSGCGGRRPRLK